jgi:uncharacterized protein involved in tolerance to divalent cations
MAEHHLSKEHTMNNNNIAVLIPVLHHAPSQTAAERVANALIQAKQAAFVNVEATCQSLI